MSLDKDLARFYSFIIEACEFTEEECWIWDGRNRGGYPRFYFEGRFVTGSRWIYEHVYGTIDENLVVDHRCKNTLCVNPLHMEAVTHRQNILRGDHRGTDTHCKYGHEYTPENTRIKYKDGQSYRQCKVCQANHKLVAKAKAQIKWQDMTIDSKYNK